MNFKGLLYALLLLPGISLAAGYASVDYSFSTIKPDERYSSADVNALQFRFGTWLNTEQTFGAEFRAALGTNDDDVYGYVPLVTLFPLEVEIDRYYGAYLRGQFPTTVPVRPYGLLGATRVETTESFLGSSRSGDYGGLSLGLGVEADIQQNIFVSLEYLRAVDGGGDEISNLSLGIGGRF